MLLNACKSFLLSICGKTYIQHSFMEWSSYDFLFHRDKNISVAESEADPLFPIPQNFTRPPKITRRRKYRKCLNGESVKVRNETRKKKVTQYGSPRLKEAIYLWCPRRNEANQLIGSLISCLNITSKGKHVKNAGKPNEDWKAWSWCIGQFIFLLRGKLERGNSLVEGDDLGTKERFCQSPVRDAQRKARPFSLPLLLH